MSDPFTHVGNVQSPEKGWHQHKGNIHLPDSLQEVQVRQHTHAGKVGCQSFSRGEIRRMDSRVLDSALPEDKRCVGFTWDS